VAEQAAQTVAAEGDVSEGQEQPPAPVVAHRASKKVYIGYELLPVSISGGARGRQAAQRGRARGQVAIVGKAATVTVQRGMGRGEHSMDVRDERDLVELLRILEYMNAA